MATMTGPGIYQTRTHDDARRMRGDAAVYDRLPTFRRRSAESYYGILTFAILAMLFMGGLGLWRCIKNTHGTNTANEQMWKTNDELRLIALQQ